MQAPAVDQTQVAALGGAVERRGGILMAAEADAAAFRDQAAKELQAQAELKARLSVQRKAEGAPPAAGGGAASATAAAAPLPATAADEAAIRKEATAEFSGMKPPKEAPAKKSCPEGGPAEEKPPVPAPNVAGRPPAAALGALAALPPRQILVGMGGVAAAATTAIGKKDQALASAPPTKQIAEGPAPPGPPPAPPAIDTTFERVAPSGGAEPDAVAGEEHVEAPPIALEGETDPANLDAQEEAGNAAAAAAGAAVKSALTTPRGEEKLNPKVKAETIKPEVPASTGGVEIPSEAVQDEASSLVAFQEKPGELNTAVAKGVGEVTKAETECTKQETDEKKKSDEEIKKAEDEHALKMKEEEKKGREEVDKERKDSDEKHAKLLTDHSSATEAKKVATTTEINAEKTKGDSEANRQVTEANSQISAEKTKGAEDARRAEEEERRKAEDGSLIGYLERGWEALKDAVATAVSAVWEAVATVVTGIVSAVVSTVGSLLKEVWNTIKGLLSAALEAIQKLVADLLDAMKALIDAALALIDAAIKKALDALQALADLLPGVLGDLLSALVTGLKAVYEAFKMALKAAIEAVKSAIKAIVSWAKSAIAGLGMLMALVKDVAPAVGKWFSNLGSSVRAGIKCHLGPALRGAIKAWWDQKVMGLTETPQQVLALLLKGGITMAMILGLAWQMVKALIPEIIVQQLIEKVVSALTLGAGTALVLLRALQAGWASIGAIVGAIQAFWGFLQAVKGGRAGAQFAAAVAASAVAVVEFAYNFLMAGLGERLKPLKDKLAAIAKKVGNKLLAATKKAGGNTVGAAAAGLDKVRDSPIGQMVAKGAEKTDDLKQKYDKWKYGTDDGKAKWSDLEAEREAAWSNKVHDRTGGRLGTSTTGTTPHRTSGGTPTDTTSTATRGPSAPRPEPVRPRPRPDRRGTGPSPGRPRHPHSDRGRTGPRGDRPPGRRPNDVVRARRPTADGKSEIRVKDDGRIMSCRIQRQESSDCVNLGDELPGETPRQAADRVAGADAAAGAATNEPRARGTGRQRPDAAPRELTPEDIRRVYGMPEQNQAAIQAFCDRKNVVIVLRPTNPASADLLDEGFLPKPQAIKSKTIDRIDREWLGFRGPEGAVGYMKPKRPKFPPGTPTDVKTQVLNRYYDRKKEYEVLKKDINLLKLPLDDPRRGGRGGGVRIRVDRRTGVIVDNETGRSFTGDHDAYDILDARTGLPVRGPRLNHMIRALKRQDIGIMHHPHLDWNPAPGKESDLYESIIKRHVGGEPLVQFGPDASPRVVHHGPASPMRPRPRRPTKAKPADDAPRARHLRRGADRATRPKDRWDASGRDLGGRFRVAGPGLPRQPRRDRRTDSRRSVTRSDSHAQAVEQERVRRAGYRAGARSIDTGVTRAGHSYGDHGAHTTAAQHERRLRSGVTPGGSTRGIPERSGRFATHAVHVEAHKRALSVLAEDTRYWSVAHRRMRIEVTVSFPLPGAGFSYSLDPVTGALVRTTVDNVRAVFRRNEHGWYDLLTMFPEP